MSLQETVEAINKKYTNYIDASIFIKNSAKSDYFFATY